MAGISQLKGGAYNGILTTIKLFCGIELEKNSQVSFINALWQVFFTKYTFHTVTDVLESGDRVEVRWKDTNFSGMFISRDENVTVIKLQNGYNLSLENSSISKINLLSKWSPNKVPVGGVKGKGKKIFILGTGGTIASYVDYETGAVKPLKTAEEMLFAQPDLAQIANVEAEVLLSILSEDMQRSDWVKIARKVYDKISEGVGVVVTHGTDTLSFTSSALSFLIENPKAPIVFTASQRSPDRPSSDAYFNLLGAAKVAQSDLGQVCVVMHSSTSDDQLDIHSGVRVRKMHTSRRDAFKSINSYPLGSVNRKLEISWNHYTKINKEDAKIYENISEKVGLLYFYPGLSKELFHDFAERNDGMIVAGTGLGHISGRFISDIKEYTARGKIIGMTSQCFYGSVNLNVYTTGRNLLEAGVIPLSDMLPEVAYTKLSFLLGNFDLEQSRGLLTRNLRGEISGRRTE
jgi:glutamyl-tRNA(Gln) amidotransferase subunit D